LALISTIYAISAHHSSPSVGLCVEHQEAMIHFRSWALLAQQALTASNCISNPTLETIQSILLVSVHLMTNLGSIATFRTLFGITLHMARTLSLHQVDSVYNRQLRKRVEINWAELEAKRRIWWHITSSDWWAISAMFPNLVGNADELPGSSSLQTARYEEPTLFIQCR
jgi:hypothetical protein